MKKATIVVICIIILGIGFLPNIGSDESKDDTLMAC
jgi:hypothetical protein